MDNISRKANSREKSKSARNQKQQKSRMLLMGLSVKKDVTEEKISMLENMSIES